MKAKATAQNARRPEERAETHRRSHFKTKYGLTVAQYDEMFAAQGGCCAVCGRPESRMKGGKVARLSVDHDHKTGKVRGLLCDKHNRALGLLGDSADIVECAAAYLRRHSA